MRIKKHKSRRQTDRKLNRSGAPVRYWPGKRVGREIAWRRAKAKWRQHWAHWMNPLLPEPPIQMQRRAVVRWYKNLYYEYTMYFPVTAETVEGKRQDFIKAIEEYKVLGAPRHPETGELFKPDHEMYIAGCDPYEPNPNVALTSLDDIAKHYKK